MFEILPHTADIRLKVTGKDLKDLFAAALLGMNEIIKPGFCRDGQKLSKHLELDGQAADVTVLLIDFLSETLAYTQEQKVVYCRAEFLELTAKRLKTKLLGAKVESFEEDIKAATYHEAKVGKNEKGEWETVIVFDI